MTTKQLSDALLKALITSDAPRDYHDDGNANVVDGLFAIAESINNVAKALHKLGLADAATPFGAVEFLSKEIQDQGQAISGALGEVAAEVRDLNLALPVIGGG